MSKKTIVLGASNNPLRYSYRAISLLLTYHHEVIPMGIKKDEVLGIKIINDLPEINNVDTITLYLGPRNQESYYKFILNTKPARIIFNPVTENSKLKQLCEQNNITCVEDCTLIMLHQGTY